MDIAAYVNGLTQAARAASASVARATTAEKDAVLERLACLLLEERGGLKAANAKDLQAGRDAGLSAAMLDRLDLSDSRIEAMAAAVRKVAALRDPVGRIIDGWTLPNGLTVDKVRVPIGVICMIYESRPNVTADAAALCLKSGNAVILRGGKEAIHSNVAIHNLIARACEESGIDPAAAQMVQTPDRAVVAELLHADACVDLVIPRGGKGLIRMVVENSTIPVIKHYEGVCHTYVDAGADLDMAVSICHNAKCQRPGVCNAMETLLVHQDIAEAFWTKMRPVFEREGVELRGCEECCGRFPGMKRATVEDWTAEYLDLVLSVRIVRNVREAIEHINRYGSHHSDAIVTRDLDSARRFVDEVDSAAVFVNTTTRFNDGEQMGLGAEIGISTDKLHARGPMALEELTTYKWRVTGRGQLRT
ncbi:MAG: glutamate-5-semialdehyde dehydrogenase [Candidatus Brocadiaceae bacterium]|mgnify:CR=1 FL=1|nr:glutamate-5-semialdehyde dehydrogenase [Candidatus Brocadiaceae bacterium]